MDVGVERQSSIEKEPRTLDIDQIHLAREAAMHVMNTRSIDEALRIFTKGLQPVVKCVGDDEHEHEHEQDDDALGDEVKMAEGLRDIVSAPF